jgi:hypothetical protein
VIGPYDALPFDSGNDIQSYDPLPYDAGSDMQTYDPLPQDAGTDVKEVGPYDALPYDSGADDEPNVPDFVPPDASVDPQSIQGLAPERPARPEPEGLRRADRSIPSERWRDTGPRRARRSPDLPLFQPPVIALVATRLDDRVRVAIEGDGEPIGTRWQSDGAITGDGGAVEWIPASDDDQIRVAARTRGGVAIASLRAADLPEAEPILGVAGPDADSRPRRGRA